MHLITLNQAKMLKSYKYGFLSGVLNLSPAFKYKGQNTCPNAGQCKAYCLQYAGRNGMSMAIEARERRTKLFYDDFKMFKALLISDLYALRKKALKENLIPTFRFNGLSDIEIEDIMPDVFELFSDIQFIDYTKLEKRLFKSNIPKNYHLTYSINEKTNDNLVKNIYENTRFNCAKVFNKLPVSMSVLIDNKKLKISSGDDSDLRHLDKRGHIVGLTYKTAKFNKVLKNKKLKSGFLTIID